MTTTLSRPEPSTPGTTPGTGPGDARRRGPRIGWLAPFAAAGTALAVSTVVPLLGPLLIGLVIGAVIANLPRIGAAAGGASVALDRRLLRLGVVLLGLKVSLDAVLGLGWRTIAIVALTVTVTFTTTRLLGRLLGVEDDLATLIASGFSICGAAAIAAMESTIRARSRDVALAVALVTIFGTAMIAALPTLAGLLGLSHHQSAVWAGASIHEVAQVVAAASLLGGGGTAVALATTVKLGRVALLAPVQVAVTRTTRGSGGRRGPLVPLFLLGFLAMAALRSTGMLSAGTLSAASALTTVLLSAAMYGLGTTIRLRDLWPLPARAFALAGLATLVAGAVPLAAVSLWL